MVAYNFTLDDVSPMIQYSGNWSRIHNDGKQDAARKAYSPASCVHCSQFHSLTMSVLNRSRDGQIFSEDLRLNEYCRGFSHSAL